MKDKKLWLLYLLTDFEMLQGGRRLIFSNKTKDYTLQNIGGNAFELTGEDICFEFKVEDLPSLTRKVMFILAKKRIETISVD
jgi:hypothetical protein